MTCGVSTDSATEYLDTLQSLVMLRYICRLCDELAGGCDAARGSATPRPGWAAADRVLRQSSGASACGIVRLDDDAILRPPSPGPPQPHGVSWWRLRR